VLPSLHNWQPFGSTVLDGRNASVWQLKEAAGEKTNTYMFYVTPEGHPLKFHSIGQDYFAGSHYDE